MSSGIDFVIVTTRVKFVINSCFVLNVDLDAGVVGDDIYLKLQHSFQGLRLFGHNGVHKDYHMLF